MRTGKNQRSGQKGQPPFQQGKQYAIIQTQKEDKGQDSNGQQPGIKQFTVRRGRKAMIQVNNPQVGEASSRGPSR